MIALPCHQPPAKVGWRTSLLIWGHDAAPLPVLCDVLDFGVCFVPLPHGKLEDIHEQNWMLKFGEPECVYWLPHRAHGH